MDGVMGLLFHIVINSLSNRILFRINQTFWLCVSYFKVLPLISWFFLGRN
jgi:hypothetical protein